MCAECTPRIRMMGLAGRPGSMNGEGPVLCGLFVVVRGERNTPEKCRKATARICIFGCVVSSGALCSALNENADFRNGQFSCVFGCSLAPLPMMLVDPNPDPPTLVFFGGGGVLFLISISLAFSVRFCPLLFRGFEVSGKRRSLVFFFGAGGSLLSSKNYGLEGQGTQRGISKGRSP